MVHGHAVAEVRSVNASRNATRNIVPVAKETIDRALRANFDLPEASERTGLTSRPRRRVLIVGDSPRLCAALARALCHPALRVRIAETPDRALGILATERIDFVIAELCLSPGSGIDFLEAVKNHHPECSRVLITGECDVAVIRDAIKRSGVSYFLGKPWDALSLQELLRNLLLFDECLSTSCDSFPADFDADVRARSVSERLNPMSAIRPTRTGIAHARSRAVARFASCESEAEVVATLASEFASIVRAREIIWWDNDDEGLYRVTTMGEGVLCGDLEDLDPTVTRALKGVVPESRPFVAGWHPTVAESHESQCGLLALPVVVNGMVLATFVVIARSATELSAWPLDLAECLIHAVGPTLARVRSACRTDNDSRTGERVHHIVQQGDGVHSEVNGCTRHASVETREIALHRTETLKLNDLALDLLGAGVAEFRDSARQD